MAPERTSLAGLPEPPPAAEQTGELVAPERAPASPERRRDLMPAIEPDRRLDDWGRSERVEGFMDRTLVEFAYRYWFRGEVEGIENVPRDGGALLVSNHSGALPPDAAMIAKAIREEHARGRPLHITVEHYFKGYPGFSMLIPKIGCVAAHPANVHRLLYDERQLVLVFPEGRKGTEKLYRDRYRLRRFGRGGFVEAAMRAEAKLVPVCVVGAEEAAPIFAQVNFMKRLTGLLYFPITPSFPWLGPLGMLGYLPAKFKIRFLEPIDTVELGGRDAVDDKALVQTVAQEIRARIQENLHEMLAKRKSVWFARTRRGRCWSPNRNWFHISSGIQNPSRGLDNRAYKAAGFEYGYTTRETVLHLAEHMRLSPVMRGVEQGYRYEREVEEFLRWSPHVRREGHGGVEGDREPLGI